MGILLILLFVGIIALVIFVNIKINNAKYRARQHVLGSVGLGASNINQAFNEQQEQGALNRLLSEYPNFSEKYVKDTLYSFCMNIINLQNNGYFSEKVLQKMPKDKLLEKIRTMQFVRINVLGYRNNILSVIVVFTDGKDEYQIMMQVTIQNQLFYVSSYDAMRGMVKGF